MPLQLSLIACLSLAASAEERRVLPVRADVPGDSRPCVWRSADGLREPRDLDALLDCQFKFRQTWVRRYADIKGRQPPDAAMDRFDDFQRAEARDYLLRHPERAQTDGGDYAAGKAEARPPKQGKTKASAGKCRAGASAWEQPTAKDPEMSKQWPLTTQALDKNLLGKGPELQADIRDLGNEMLRSSDGGRLGVTPAAAQSVLDFLGCQQGGATPEMLRLLKSVSEDGASIKAPTLLQLKRAAREAQDKGLDLGVETGLEKWLLDPSTDPEVAMDDLVPN